MNILKRIIIMESKTVCVFGAGGRVGKEVVKLALLQGFKVKAQCRPNSNCSFKHENLTVLKGDLLNYEFVQGVVRDCDCAIITFGQRPPYKDIFCEEATANITRALKELNIPRLICLTGAIAGESDKNLTVPFKIFRKALARKYKDVFNDRIKQESIVKESSLQWTIVKPPRLVENGERRIFIYSESLKMGLGSSIGFDDLAEFLVEQINSKDYFHKSVYVKY